MKSRKSPHNSPFAIAREYAKANNINIVGNITDFCKEHKATIDAWSAKGGQSDKGANKISNAKGVLTDLHFLNDGINQLDEKAQRELIDFMAETEKRMADISAKAATDAKERGEKLKLEKESLAQQAAKRMAIAANFVGEKNVRAVAGDIYDNRKADFGTPNTIHRLGNTVHLFANNKNGVRNHISFPVKQLIQMGVEQITGKLHFPWNPTVVSKLQAAEESARFENLV